ncbi:MAG TPA: hypothetical protein HPQ04_08450 [Rhodospirillaceae bacterium]|nr:hypothetical protein [Rhodospirillaceae bacterium]
MHFDWSTLALQSVNVLILCWLLHRFLYQPVLGLMDQRRRLIDSQLEGAAIAQAKAEAELAAITGQRQAIAAERDAVLAAAAQRAETLAGERLAEGGRQAAAMMEASRQALAAERLGALAEARRGTLDLAAAMAGRLLAALPSDARAAAWIDLIEEKLLTLTAEERQALCRQIDAESPLDIVTAAPLSPEAQAAWRTRLAAVLDGDPPLRFAVDASLLAGAALVFPAAEMRVCWKDTLAGLRSEMEATDGSER